jgi:uncharacterized protein YdiU (UPF0061 family)
MDQQVASFNFDNTFARDMDGFYVAWQGEVAPSPELLIFNEDLAQELGLDTTSLSGDHGAQVFSGSVAPLGAEPIAQIYAGHQFGGFSPQLGDGRALLLGEVLNQDGARRDIQLKGSGRTPFSRGGDGKAVLGPVLREYLMGEAMHALGVPTTRALAAVTTGEKIHREGLQSGAVLTRVAASHLRVGTFQFFAARGKHDSLAQLANYAIARHYPHLQNVEDKYLKFLSAVVDAQVLLVAKWVNHGFIHGVMNTDNMTISGETIDYGPCAFIDDYDPKAVFSSIDTGGRYAYGNQPNMAQWNLSRLAETLLALIDPEDQENAVRLATNVVNEIPAKYIAAWLEGARLKIGLHSQEAEDVTLINELLQSMEGQGVDFTQMFRRLADAATGQSDALIAMFDDPTKISAWILKWQDRCLRDPQTPKTRATNMNAVNPIYIPRNHNVEAVLAAAATGDLKPFHRLSDVLSKPYTKRPGFEAFEGPAPDDFGPFKTFCGT